MRCLRNLKLSENMVEHPIYWIIILVLAYIALAQRGKIIELIDQRDYLHEIANNLIDKLNEASKFIEDNIEEDET